MPSLQNGGDFWSHFPGLRPGLFSFAPYGSRRMGWVIFLLTMGASAWAGLALV
jgi:hypothetical protein